MYGYVYKTTNLINSKIYVGQKKSSIFLGNKYLGSGVALKRAVSKYGSENFTVELLTWCDTKEELSRQERYWITKLSSKSRGVGYNIASGGEGCDIGGFRHHKHSEETKRKISTAVSKVNQTVRKGRKMRDLFQDYKNGMKDQPARNKGKIKVYNKETGESKFVDRDLDLSLYPHWSKGTPERSKAKTRLHYLYDLEYQKQLKQRHRNTRFMYNDSLRLCKRVNQDQVEVFLQKGWCLGRRIYSKNV